MGGIIPSPNFITGDVTITGGNLTLDNNKAYRMNDSGGTPNQLLRLDASGTVSFATPTAQDTKIYCGLGNQIQLIEFVTPRLTVDSFQEQVIFASGRVTFLTGNPVLTSTLNIASVTETTTGEYNCNFVTDPPDVNYTVIVTPVDDVSVHATVGGKATTDFDVFLRTDTGSVIESPFDFVVIRN